MIREPTTIFAAQPKAYNCLAAKTVFLNILVDWNEDGDWNDNMNCQTRTSCAYEWAVKNSPITLPAGCATLTSPAFQTGPKTGHGWLRISISDDPVTDDFPWAGSAQTATGALIGGETEDYPVEIVCPQNPCDLDYTDLGDAPEARAAYPSGVTGNFPSCLFPFPAGTQELFCLPISTTPLWTGAVEHVALAGDPVHFWLGCGPPPHAPPGGIDSEPDAKVNTPTVGFGACPNMSIPTDCVETAFGGMTFDQDECHGDVVDAGIAGPVSFVACSTGVVTFDAYSCGPAGQTQEAYLNILVDWNEDGDWNDNFKCGGTASPGCAYEWAVKNALIALPSGCTTMLSPTFLTGPRPGNGWMRVTLTAAPVSDDFPWGGSFGVGGAPFQGGETEDYPVEIIPSLVGVGDDARPKDLWLASASPNPSRDRTNIRFGLPRDREVSVSVYDVAGRKLRQLVSGILPAGEHSVPWDYRDQSGAQVPAGLYLVKLQAENRVLTQRAIRVK